MFKNRNTKQPRAMWEIYCNCYGETGKNTSLGNPGKATEKKKTLNWACVSEKEGFLEERGTV